MLKKTLTHPRTIERASSFSRAQRELACTCIRPHFSRIALLLPSFPCPSLPPTLRLIPGPAQTSTRTYRQKGVVATEAADTRWTLKRLNDSNEPARGHCGHLSLDREATSPCECVCLCSCCMFAAAQHVCRCKSPHYAPRFLPHPGEVIELSRDVQGEATQCTGAGDDPCCWCITPRMPIATRHNDGAVHGRPAEGSIFRTNSMGNARNHL